MINALAIHYRSLSSSKRVELLATCRSYLDVKFEQAKNEYDDGDKGFRISSVSRLQEIEQLRHKANDAERNVARDTIEVVDAYLEALQADAAWQDLGVELGFLDEPRSNLTTA